MEIKEKAAMMSGFFTKKKRDDGREFWLVTDGAPEWVKKIVQKAHGDFFPDDWRKKKKSWESSGPSLRPLTWTNNRRAPARS